MATIYGFVAEWFDEVARISKQFLLKLFVHSNEIEVILTDLSSNLNFDNLHTFKEFLFLFLRVQI